MPTPTEQLQRLLTDGPTIPNFKKLAMDLVKNGADATARSTTGSHFTLLHILARTNQMGANNADITELLRLNPNTLKSRDKLNRTALQALMDHLYDKECILGDFKQSAMILAKEGADLTVRSTRSAHPTLLHILTRTNQMGVNNKDIAELVRLNPDILKSTDKFNRNAIQSLMHGFHCGENAFDNFKQSAMTLARNGINLSLQATALAHDTLLHVLVRENIAENILEIDELIQINPEVVNFRNHSGQTPIHSLLHNIPGVTRNTIQKLLSETNLHLVDNKNATLLHAACNLVNLDAAKYLFSKGLSLTALTNDNETLLHSAVVYSNTALIEWLLDSKQIDINAQDKYGATALHRATRRKHPDVIKLLVSYGADLTIKNNYGQRASEIAIQSGANDLVPHLLNKNEFSEKIKAMHDYGALLKKQGAPKGQVAINLASDLAYEADKFFKQPLEQRNFAEFEPKFSKLLHSKDKKMSAYRISWGTIVKNIAIALTGIGVLLIAGKLAHSKMTEGRALFFSQKSKTTSEEKLAAVQQSMGKH